MKSLKQLISLLILTTLFACEDPLKNANLSSLDEAKAESFCRDVVRQSGRGIAIGVATTCLLPFAFTDTCDHDQYAECLGDNVDFLTMPVQLKPEIADQNQAECEAHFTAGQFETCEVSARTYLDCMRESQRVAAEFLSSDNICIDVESEPIPECEEVKASCTNDPYNLGSDPDEIDGEMADEMAGEMADEMAGEVAGEMAEEMAGEMAGEVAGEMAEEMAGEMAGEVAGEIADEMAGEMVAGESIGEGSINELDGDGRAAYCNAKYDYITGFVADNEETFEAALANSCLIGALFEGMNQESCEAVVSECIARASMQPSRVDFVAECIAEESFFTECAASASDVLTCENERITESINAFSIVDLSAFSCERAGDVSSLNELFPILERVTPPADLCAPEVSMCLAGEDG